MLLNFFVVLQTLHYLFWEISFQGTLTEGGLCTVDLHLFFKKVNNNFYVKKVIWSS